MDEEAGGAIAEWDLRSDIASPLTAYIMAPSKRMHLQYAEAFNDQALGYGLIHPVSTERLHPGVCGYFDDDGDWKTIVDIPKIDGQVKALGDLHFTPLDEVPALPSPTSMRWEPKCSSTVSYTKDSASTSIG